jgi:sugar phosphate isomerase/epimerase
VIDSVRVESGNNRVTMTTFSFATSAIGNPSSARFAVEWAIEHGFGGVEFNAPRIRLVDLSQAERGWLLEMAREHDLSYTHHAPTSLLPASHDPGTRERDLAELIDEIKVAGDLGVEVIILHPGKLDVPGIEPEEASEAERAAGM